jgi:CBS domain-containing protein
MDTLRGLAFGLQLEAIAAHSGPVSRPLPKMNISISTLLARKGSVVHSVSPSMTIAEAVTVMNRHKIGAVVVLDGDRLVGIFTERDVLRSVVGAEVNPKTSRVVEVMTTDVLTVSPEMGIEEATVIFTEKRCRHLPVSSNGKLCGVVSIGDITRWMADAHRAEAEHLKNYIAGGFPS